MKINYKELFTDRVIYITGVGRSGTTIIGQILSSMQPVYYLFEPASLRAPLNDDYRTLRRNLFEDYFLPQIHGRMNPNPQDWTYMGNAKDLSDLENRWKVLRRRDDALELIKEEDPLWIIKNPEAQPLFNMLSEIFPNIKFLNIQRNGLDVVASCLERGWFKNNYQPIDPVHGNGCPWYVLPDVDSIDKWADYDQTTRAACNWRVLSEKEMDNAVNIKYEDFIKHPFQYIDEWSVDFGIDPTHLTHMHGQRVKDFRQEDRPKIDIKDIMEPERKRFCKTMEKLGYEV